MLTTIARRFIAAAILFSFFIALIVPGMQIDAAPSGASVESGSVQISQNASTTTLRQSSDKAIINWQSYNIAANELVQYLQPSQSSVALNRVNGGNPSTIFGRLEANGRVFLLNPNGVLFGSGSQVNVGGLLASTLSMNSGDFNNGYYHLTQDPSKTLASVINQGNIQAAGGGSAALVAPLAYNSGLIVANQGQIAIGGTKEAVISFDSNRLINFIAMNPNASSETILIPADAANDIIQNVVNKNILPAGALKVNADGSHSLTGASGLGVNAGMLQAGQAEVSGTDISLAGGRLKTNSLILDPSSLTITDDAVSGDLFGELTTSGSSTSLASNAANQGSNTLDWSDLQWATTITLATTGAITINISTASLPNAAVKFTGSGISVASGSAMTFKTFDVSGVTGAITNVNSTTIAGTIIRPSSSSTTSSTSSSSSSSSSSTNVSTSSSSGSSSSTASASTSSTASSNAATASIVSNSISTSSQNSAETSQALTANMSNFAGSPGNTKGSYVTIGSNVVSGPGAVTSAINNSVSSVSEGNAVVWGTPTAARNTPLQGAGLFVKSLPGNVRLVSSSVKPDGTTVQTYRHESGEVDTIQKSPNGATLADRWYPNGDHNQIALSPNGNKVTTGWHKNGDTDRTTRYKNGDTVKEQWFKDGNHSRTTGYATGVKVTVNWHKNGDTDRTTQYKNGDTVKEQWFKNGSSMNTETHPNGSSVVTKNYTNGVKVTEEKNSLGVTTTTTTKYPNGGAVKITLYSGGTTETDSYPNGMTKETTHSSDGGTWSTTRYPNGETDKYVQRPTGSWVETHQYPNGDSTTTTPAGGRVTLEVDRRGGQTSEWYVVNGAKFPATPLYKIILGL